MKKAALVIFILFHMTAVALYAIPWSADDAPTRWVRTHLANRVHPYVLSLSQWQQWNLFSPDPLRRISYFVFQYDHEGTWITLQHYKPGMHSWWRHANRFKLYGEFLDAESTKYHPVIERMLHRLCVTENLQPNTPIRTFRSIAIIPKHDEPMPASWWRTWQPEFRDAPPIETACPDEATMATLLSLPE